MSQWDEDQHGLIIKVVTGWDTALLAEAGCLLRVEFLNRTESIDDPPDQGALQLGMTASEARQIAADLVEMADQAEQVPPGVRPS